MTAGKHETHRGLPRSALLAAAFFALGLGAARLLGFMSPAPAPSPGPPAAAPLATSSPATAPIATADAGGPRIFFDPASISLLPDASLHLRVPEAPDAGVSAP